MDSPIVTEYFYNGSILAGQKTGDDVVVFMYDNNGDIFGFTYNGEPYYYVKNAQNDVYLIVNADCQAVVLYQYDAWGNITECYDLSGCNLSGVNPITYRSYYFDAELGAYFLNSRYYASGFRRFINADKVIAASGESVHGYNLFAYSFNNPVNLIDENGNWPKWIEKAAKVVAVATVVVTAVVLVSVVTAGTGGLALGAAGVAFGTACGGLVGGMANAKKGGSFIKGWVGGTINGFIQSIGSAVAGPLGTIIGGGLGSGVGTAVTDSLNNIGKAKQQQKTSKEIVISSVKAAAAGVAMSTITAGIGYGIDFAQNSTLGYNAWGGSLSPGAGIAPITPGFGEMMKGFFSMVDDAIAYMSSD